MNTQKLVSILGKVLTVTAGVLVAFKVQSYLGEMRVQAPSTAE